MMRHSRVYRASTLLISILAATQLIVGTAVAGQSDRTKGRRDPIVGTWRLNQQYGTYEHLIEARADGVLIHRLMGSAVKGSWSRLPNGRYLLEPAGPDDFAIVKSGQLLLFDSSGLISVFDPTR